MLPHFVHALQDDALNVCKGVGIASAVLRRCHGDVVLREVRSTSQLGDDACLGLAAALRQQRRWYSAEQGAGAYAEIAVVGGMLLDLRRRGSGRLGRLWM